jgi:hypothetical protein
MFSVVLKKNGLLWLGNNVSWFAHFPETWPENNVPWFAYLWETSLGNNIF